MYFKIFTLIGIHLYQRYKDGFGCVTACSYTPVVWGDVRGRVTVLRRYSHQCCQGTLLF